MTAGATTFLGSASERLLPPELVFRFFQTAVLFHLAAWILLAVHGDEITYFRGGGGPVLAALHLFTLGVFAMTAMGASLQLLPVATLQGFAAPWIIHVLWWLMTGGTLCLAVGMYADWIDTKAFGGLGVTSAIVLYLLLLAGNLRSGGAMTVVRAHGWTAGACLFGVLALGLALLVNQRIGWMENGARAGVSHMLLATYGFMGFLAMGFSYVLVPMFALAPPPSDRWAAATLAVAVIALVLGVTGTWFGRDAWAAAGAVLGLVAAVGHLTLMLHTLRQRMRKRLGPAFMLIVLSWGLLPLSLLLGMAWAMDWAADWAAALFTLSLFAWLLSLLLAVLQRIVPFLASMHAATSLKRRPPTVTALTSQKPLTVHTCCHCGAISLLSLGILADLPLLCQLGAAIGIIGALAFAWFFYFALIKFRMAISAPVS